MTCIVTIDLDEYLNLPARQLKAKLRALRLEAEQPSRARVRGRVSLSSEDSKNLEREKDHQLPRAWREAAVAERQRLGLPEVNLDVEYGKFVLWFEDKGREIRLGSWLVWALRAWLDRTNTPAVTTGGGNPPIPPPNFPIPHISPTIGDEREQRQARDWVNRGFWLRNGSWGPPPDHPGCTLPAALVAWCRQNENRR